VYGPRVSLDLFDRLSLFIDLLTKHPKVFVVERSVAPPAPLQPEVAQKIDDEARAFFDRTSELRFWWFLESKRAYESPEDYLPGTLGGFIHLVAPESPDLVIDRLPDGRARFNPPTGVVYEPKRGARAYLGRFGSYVQRACHSAFAAEWQATIYADELGLQDSFVQDMRRHLLGPQDRHLVKPVDPSGFRPYERPCTGPEARVKGLVERGATDAQARSLVEWLGDDVALLLG